MSPLGCDTFSELPCFWWPWQFGGALVRYFVECPSTGMCLTFISWWDWGNGFWGEEHRGKVPFLSHHIKGTQYRYDLSLLMLALITWPREYTSGFSTVKVSFPFHTVLFGRKSLGTAHTQGVKSNTPSTPEICLLIYLFVAVRTHGYSFYSLDYNSRVLHLFCCLSGSSSGHWAPPVAS